MGDRIILRKYGEEAVIPFTLREIAGGQLKTDAVEYGPNCSLMKDEGAEAPCANGFVDEGIGYSLVLTAAEMEAARIVLYIIDTAVKVWLDRVIIIETYGHASAQHAFDLDLGIQIVAGAPSAHVPDAASVIVTGNENANTYAACATDNGTRWQIGDTGAGLEVVCEMNLGADRFPTAVLVNGYFDAAPAGSNVVEIYVYNYITATYDKLSAGTATTEMRNANSDKDYQFSLAFAHHDTMTSPGEVKIKFLSNGANNGDELLLDFVQVSASPYGAPSSEAIAQEVWERNLLDVRAAYAAGHDLKRMVALETTVAVEGTASTFTLTDGIPSGIAYRGMLIDVRNESSATRDIETRRIISYTAGRVVAVDRPFSFTPTVDDHVHVLGLGYSVVEGFRENVAFDNFEFLMVDSTDHITPKTGLIVTGYRSIDGGAFAAVTGAIAEVSNGIYKIDFAAADKNGRIITFRFTAPAADARFITIKTTP